MKSIQMNKNQLRHWFVAIEVQDIQSLFVRTEKEAISYIQPDIIDKVTKIELEPAIFNALCSKLSLPLGCQQIDAWPNIFVRLQTKQDLLDRIVDRLTDYDVEGLKKLLATLGKAP